MRIISAHGPSGARIQLVAMFQRDYRLFLSMSNACDNVVVLTFCCDP